MMSLPVGLSTMKPVPAKWDPAFFLSKRRHSAVLVLLEEPDEEAEEASVILIRRSTRVGSHRGQIGFPGGRLEESDIGPGDTALREAFEEIGVNRSSIKIVGGLPPVPSLDGTLVYPVVGTIRASECLLQTNASEVQSVHRIPWKKLSTASRRKFSFNMFGCWRDSFLYDCGDILVWGLSAEILASADFKEGL